MKPTSIIIVLFALCATVSIGNAGFLDDAFNQVKASLKDIAQRLQKGEKPIEIIRNTIADHPEIVQKVDMVHGFVCPEQEKIPAVQQRAGVADYVKIACSFVDKHLKEIKEQIAKPKPKRSVISDVGDKLSQAKKTVENWLTTATLISLYVGVQSVELVEKTIKDAIRDHPEIVDKLDIIHKVCPHQVQPDAIQEVAADVQLTNVQKGCAVIRKNLAIFKEEVAKYAAEAKTWIESAAQSAKDTINPYKEKFLGWYNMHKQEAKDWLASQKDKIKDKFNSGKQKED